MSQVDGAVLVVEDEYGVRMDVVARLKREGYRVIEAKDGELALRWIEKQRRLLALVTDIQMPGQGGMEVAHAARQRWPEIPVVFVSGAINAMEVAASVQGSRLLPKPVATDLLLQQLTELLEDNHEE